MRSTTLALAFAALLALPAAALADDIADCNSDQPDTVIKGCTQLIKAGNANNDALAIAFFNRGNAFDDNGDHDGAIADYTQSIKLKADDPNVFLNRGLSYMAKQDFDSALADFNQAVQLKPKFPRAIYNQGRAYEGKGDLKQALATYERAAALAPNNQNVAKKVTELKQKLGQ